MTLRLPPFAQVLAQFWTQLPWTQLKQRSLRWLCLGLFLVASLSFAPAPADAAGCTLRIIGWEGYMDPSFAQPFEQETGCKVIPTYAGSSDEMYAKIRASRGKTYDLVTASGDLTRRLYDSGLVQPLDLAKVPNYSDLFPLFQQATYNTFDGEAYGVSIGWGPDFLIYDSTVVTETPESWKVLYQPEYANKISLPDYPIFAADVALWQQQPDIYDLSADTLNTDIKPQLLPLRDQVRKFWTSQGELSQLFLNREVSLAWAWPVTIAELKRANFPIAATIPQEGTTGWSDSWMLMKGSQNSDIAHQWMNYMLTGSAQKAMSDVTGYWPVSSQVMPLLTAEQISDWHLDDLEDYYSNIYFWETVPNYDEWVALWSEFRGQ
jgi:spermidine/putrescine-binding protein